MTTKNIYSQNTSKNINANSDYNNFSKHLAIAFHVDADSKDCYGAGKQCLKHEDGSNLAIYMLQTIQIQSKNFNLIFHLGCRDLVCKKKGMGRATKIYNGALTLSGVGDDKKSCKHGLFSVN